ncbi:MAG TPA: hypothetical protein VFU80_02080, partial [Sphingomicrobium sp.]|nr:hypothetical protein [Sphingomicrobium sp.]
MFQDFSGKEFAVARAEAPTSSALRDVSALISRYPSLSEVELARLINLYRQLPALDVALMISDEELAPRLDRFFNDHRSELRTPFRQYAVFVAI